MCKLDHKEIGKQLDIFCFSENVGKGLPMWLNNGVIIRDELISYLKKIQLRMGYQSVISPHIGNKKLYEISGHYEKYKDHSFGEISCPDGESYMLKPMNCPHHCQIYKNEPFVKYIGAITSKRVVSPDGNKSESKTYYRWRRDGERSIQWGKGQGLSIKRDNLLEELFEEE